jgi:hypothetical protein
VIRLGSDARAAALEDWRFTVAVPMSALRLDADIAFAGARFC